MSIIHLSIFPVLTLYTLLMYCTHVSKYNSWSFLHLLIRTLEVDSKWKPEMDIALQKRQPFKEPRCPSYTKKGSALLKTEMQPFSLCHKQCPPLSGPNENEGATFIHLHVLKQPNRLKLYAMVKIISTQFSHNLEKFVQHQSILVGIIFLFGSVDRAKSHKVSIKSHKH